MPKLLTIREAAKATGLHEHAIRRLVAEKKIPSIRLSPRGKIYIPENFYKGLLPEEDKERTHLALLGEGVTVTITSDEADRMRALGKAVELVIAAYEKEKNRKEASADAGI